MGISGSREKPFEEEPSIIYNKYIRDLHRNRCASNVHACFVFIAFAFAVVMVELSHLVSIDLNNIDPSAGPSLSAVIGTNSNFLTPDSLTFKIGFAIEWIMLSGYIVSQALPAKYAPSDFIAIDATKLSAIGVFGSFGASLLLFKYREQSLSALILLMAHTYFLFKVHSDMFIQYSPQKNVGSWQLQTLVFSGFSVALAWTIYICVLTGSACLQQSFKLDVVPDIACALLSLLSVFAARLVFMKADFPYTCMALLAFWGVIKRNQDVSISSVDPNMANQAVVVWHTAAICMVIVSATYICGFIYTCLITNRSRESIYYDASVAGPHSMASSPLLRHQHYVAPGAPEGILRNRDTAVSFRSLEDGEPEVDL